MKFLSTRQLKKQLALRGVTGVAASIVHCTDTNLYARAALSDCDRVILAPVQNGEHVACCGRGGAYFTVQLNRDVTRDDAKKYIMLATIAVRKAIKELGVDCDASEKPADLTVKGKKIAVFDCEYAVTPARKALLLGIKINIVNDITAIKAHYTTLAMQAVDVTREKLTAAVVANLLQQEQDYYAKLLDNYKKLSAIVGKTVTFGKTSGKVAAVDKDGQVVVEVDGKSPITTDINNVKVVED